MGRRHADPVRLTPAQIADARRQFEEHESKFDAMGESAGIREIRSPLTKRMLRPLTGCRVMQTCKTLADDEYRAVAALLETSPDVLFRIYGPFLEEPIKNLDFLRYFSKVRRFCIHSWSLEDLDGLRHLPRNLVELDLGESAFKKPLRWIAEQFPALTTLRVASKVDDPANVGLFPHLKELFVLGCTFKNLDCLLPLKQLKKLTLMGGTTRNLDALARIGALQYIELCRNSALQDCDLAPLAKVATLQYLNLIWLSKIQRLPDFGSNSSLKRVDIRTLNRLVDVSGLSRAPRLRTICISDVRSWRSPTLECLIGHSTLHDGFVGLATVKETNSAAQMLPLAQADYGTEFRFD